METHDNQEIVKKKRVKPVFIAVIFLAVVLAALIATFFVFGSKYKNKFLKNTFINGIYVGDMTAEEANEAIAAAMPGYSLELKFKDGKGETIKGEDIGFKYDGLGDIEELLLIQVPSDFIKGVFGSGPVYESSVDMKRSFDEAKLEEAVRALPEVQKENMKEPKDAYVDLDKAKGTFNLVAEEEGSLIDVDKLVESVKDAASNFDLEMDVKNEKLYIEPTSRSTDEDMKSLLDTMNGCVGNEGITFELYDSDVVLDKDTLVSWLKKDKEGHYYKDQQTWDENLDKFLDELERAVDEDSTNWVFDSTGLGTFNISGGDFPKKLNKPAEKEQIMRDLQKAEPVKRAPIFITADGATTNHGLGGTYVEIDVSRQMLWAYNQGQCWMETDIVTGKATSDRYTPQGVYKLDWKKTDTELRGRELSDGVYEYEVHVDYWMPFNDDIGMHDASWVYNFGGNTYLWGGSRGCINMPVDMAPLMYDFIQEDIPIVVYYSEDPVWIE